MRTSMETETLVINGGGEGNQRVSSLGQWGLGAKVPI